MEQDVINEQSKEITNDVNEELTKVKSEESLFTESFLQSYTNHHCAENE